MESPKFELKSEGKKSYLIITCELPAKPKESASGKSMLHATTNGNMNTNLKIDGKDLIAGINVYTKK